MQIHVFVRKLLQEFFFHEFKRMTQNKYNREPVATVFDTCNNSSAAFPCAFSVDLFNIQPNTILLQMATLQLVK